jgi:hypothetical protein
MWMCPTASLPALIRSTSLIGRSGVMNGECRPGGASEIAPTFSILEERLNQICRRAAASRSKEAMNTIKLPPQSRSKCGPSPLAGQGSSKLSADDPQPRAHASKPRGNIGFFGEDGERIQFRRENSGLITVGHIHFKPLAKCEGSKRVDGGGETARGSPFTPWGYGTTISGAS